MHLDTQVRPATLAHLPEGSFTLPGGKNRDLQLTSKVLGKAPRSSVPIFPPARRAEFRGTADFSILRLVYCPMFLFRSRPFLLCIFSFCQVYKVKYCVFIT